MKDTQILKVFYGRSVSLKCVYENLVEKLLTLRSFRKPLEVLCLVEQQNSILSNLLIFQTESRHVDSTSINSIMWHRKRKGLEYHMFLGSHYFDGDDWEMLIP